jgi:hypothetical protein
MFSSAAGYTSRVVRAEDTAPIDVPQTVTVLDDTQSTDVISNSEISSQSIVIEQPPVVGVATISATKIVCPNEADLPNWGAGGADITATTATDFLATHQNCHLQEGWNFAWSVDGVGNPGDNVLGTGGAGWSGFDSTTNASGVATATVPAGAKVWVREQMQDGYIPFTGGNTDQNVSAEFYCNSDVLNYDNWEWIDPVVGGHTYSCVAFNAPKTGSIKITKYTCPADTVINRNDNGPSETDINDTAYTVPVGCVPQAGKQFGYTYDAANSTNNTGPYLGLFGDTTPFTPFATTDAGGISLNENMPSSGRYIVAELNSDGNQLSSDQMLGLYCYGDGDTTPTNNDNQEITFAAAGQVANCVAYNKAPTQECGDHSLDVVSDTSNVVFTEGNAIATWVHPSWVTLPGATWIWNAFNVATPSVNESKTFTKTFNIIGRPISATLDVAADNSYEGGVNTFPDLFVDLGEFNYGSPDHYTVPIEDLSPGSNTISFFVTNFGVDGSTPTSNPAGLLYKLHVESNDCPDQNPASLTVIKHVINGTGGIKTASDFTMTVTGAGVSTSSFAGSETGATVTLSAGSYNVDEIDSMGYLKTVSTDCTGTILAGQHKTCTITNTYQAPQDPHKGYVTIIKHVNNIHGGTKIASDFWLFVTGHGVTQHNYVGSEAGVTVAFDPGTYQVKEVPAFGYTSTYSSDCFRVIHPGEHFTCTVTNTDPDTTLYAPYCGDGVVNQTWEMCDNGAANGVTDNVCTAQCQNINQCTTKAFARAVNTAVSNTGDGDMTTDVFLGGNSYALNRIPTGTWFMIFDGVNYVSDPTMNGTPLTTWSNVPGLAIERMAGGIIRSNMFGYHKHDTTVPANYSGTEHTDGYLEFFNTTPLTQSNDTFSDWHIEKWTDGIFGGESNDEISISGIKSNFWLGVKPASDSFFTTYSAPENTCQNDTSAPTLSTGGSGGPSWSAPELVTRNGAVLGASTASTDTGKVLGEQTSCGLYLDTFIKAGHKNNPDTVKKLQTFLNSQLKLNLPVTGIYSKATEAAVKKFQSQRLSSVLTPWKISKPTGIVYLTTVTDINNIMCPQLNLPIPTDLISFSKHPKNK